MKNINFKYYLVVFVFLFSSLFAGCNEPSSPSVTEKSEGKVKLRCVIPKENATKLEAVKSFEEDIKKQFPDYDITFSYINGDLESYDTKIKVLLSSKDKPDVFFSKGNDFFSELFSVNAIQPIDKYLNELKFWDMVIPSAKVDGYNGKIYAVPFEEVHYEVMEINSDLFEKNKIKVPTNFEELKNAVSTFKSKGIMPIAVGGKDGRAVYNMIESFAVTLNPQVTKKIMNNKEKFSDDSFKETAIKVKELMDMEAFGQKPELLTDADAAKLFYSGKAAMYCTSSSNFDISNKNLKGKCKLIYYPCIGESNLDDSSSLVSSLQKNSGLFISSTSKHPKEAVSLAVEVSKHYNKYLYEKKNNVSTIYIPSKQNWKISNKANTDLQLFMEGLYDNKNISISLLNSSINAKASKAIVEASSVFMTGLLSADSYTKELDKAMNLKK